MFYSQTFLGRKGPLGTVWCAAHLQHRLKKTHYTSTNIPETVDYIMCPQVPIALRTSGHLLLGIVRIYSKKVDYLFHDCNNLKLGLRKVFAPVEVDLPDNARQAPIQSITLPSTFELDSLDLDDTYHEGNQDEHVSSQEDITLMEQIPTGRDPFITISFDEDTSDLSKKAHVPDTGVSLTMEDNVRSEDHSPTPHPPEVNMGSSQDAGPRSRGDADDAISMQNLPEIEIMRDAVHDFGFQNFSSVMEHGNDANELMRSNQMMSEKEAISSPMEDILDSGGPSIPLQHLSGAAGSADPKDAPLIPDEAALFEHASPELVIRSSPRVQQPPAKKRKRKQLFDECVVLKNSFMKKALENPSDILRQRKPIPCSALGLWKLNIHLRREWPFDEPLMTGICAHLQNAFKKDYISSHHLVLQQEAPQESVATRTPGRTMDVDMEIEHLRHEDGQINSNLPDFFPFTAGDINASPQRDALTPVSPSLMSASELPEQTDVGTGVPPSSYSGMSTGPYRSDTETPLTFMEENTGLENTGLSDIPEMSAAEDLCFLEADNTSPAGSWRSDEAEPLSVRTRAVAQFLRRYSPTAPASEDSEDLSLNKILEGKKRRICARMFFETLVLKSYGLIDVKQDEPYGDIHLKLTSRLSKAQI